jgi:sulfatase modifying factor 1
MMGVVMKKASLVFQTVLCSLMFCLFFMGAFSAAASGTNELSDLSVSITSSTPTATHGPASSSGMVLIPGGTNSGTDPDFGAYSLTVNSFYMDKYEVTKALWDEVYTWAIAHGYSFDNAGSVKAGSGKAATHPVHTVNWYDCVKWCNARSQKEGRPAVYTVSGAVYKTGQADNVVQSSAAGYRFPTDVEWKYAARGGLRGKRFPWGDTIQHARANYYSSSSHSYDTSATRGYHPDWDEGDYPYTTYTSPVGAFAPNGYGLYDMSGNVWEWCFDLISGKGSLRVRRGGSWNYLASRCRVANRINYIPLNASNYIGFRACLPPRQQ